MIETPSLNQAIALAALAHEGQTDKAGQPYILHPLRVMLACQGEAAQICAVLHDVVEDTPWTLAALREAGYSESVLMTLDHLTKRPGENYEQFIDRVLENELACLVKLADLADNQDLSRLAEVTTADQERLLRYQAAEKRVRAHMQTLAKSNRA